MLRAQISVRLESVCAGWPPELFEQLVDSIVAITLKYEKRGGSPLPYDRRATEHLIDSIKELLDRNEQLHKDE